MGRSKKNQSPETEGDKAEYKQPEETVSTGNRQVIVSPETILVNKNISVTDESNKLRIDIPSDKLLVDKKLFFEIWSALGKGFTHGLTMSPAISRFAKALGAKDQKEEYRLWEECLAYLKENK